MEVTGIQGRRRKQILDDLQETRRYWKLKEDTPDRSVLRTSFGGDKLMMMMMIIHK